MLKTLLCFAALIACAMSAAILYNEIGAQGTTPHIIGWETTKQYGEGIHHSAGYPWTGQQDKEYLMGVLAQPGYHHGIESVAHVGPLGYQLGGLFHHQTGTPGPLAYAVQQPYGIQGDQWQGLVHGVSDQASHLYVDEHGVLHQGIHQQFGQHADVEGLTQFLPRQEGIQGTLWQGQHYPSQLVYPHYQTGQHYIASEGVELLKAHPQQFSAIPIAGGIGQYSNDVDDSILLQKLYPTQHITGGLLGHQIGQGFDEDTIPLIAVDPSGHVVGVMHQTKAWPFQAPSGVHQWQWSVGNHHY